MVDPLTADEFTSFVSANIGRHLIGCNWTIHYGDEQDRGSCQFFWNDCLLDSYYDESQADPDTGRCDFQVDSDSPAQPYRRPALQIVYKDVSTFDLGHVYHPTAEDRLRLFETLTRLRQEAEGDPLDSFRVRPVI
jgi:hypothetical protein